MTVPVSPTLVDDEHLYPLHKEDDVPESPLHELLNTYLRPALRTRFPGWFVTGNVCVYWEQGNTRDYVAPDVLVTTGPPPRPRPRVYRLWESPPVIFVAEVFSASDTRAIREDKETKYAQHVRALEYLSYDERRHILQLRRLGPRGYEKVAPEPNGRVRSEQLQLEFGVDAEGFLRIYTLEGERLHSHEELERLAEEETERRREAEARAATAEARAAREARERDEAEVRAAEAEARVAAAEARAAEEAARREELERELAALRARPQNGET